MENVNLKRSIRYLYLLYALYGLLGLASALTALLSFLISPRIPEGVSSLNYSSIYETKKSVEILIYASFFSYGVFGIIHQEGRTKAAFYVPQWFLAIGGFVLFILSGLEILLCATPEAGEEAISYWLKAHYLDPVYLISFVGGILLIQAYQREDRGQHFLKEGYIGLSFLFPLFVYDLVLFALDVLNSKMEVLPIVITTFLFAFRLSIFILSYFALSEADE
jgi:hypothetical protein